MTTVLRDGPRENVRGAWRRLVQAAAVLTALCPLACSGSEEPAAPDPIVEDQSNLKKETSVAEPPVAKPAPSAHDVATAAPPPPALPSATAPLPVPETDREPEPPPAQHVLIVMAPPCVLRGVGRSQCTDVATLQQDATAVCLGVGLSFKELLSIETCENGSARAEVRCCM